MAFCCCSCCYCFHSPSNQSLQQVQEMNAKPFQRPQWCQSPYWIVCLQEGICPAQLAFTFTKLSNVMEMVAVNRLLIELAIREPKATEADWKCGVLCLRQDQRQNWGAWSQVLAQLVFLHWKSTVSCHITTRILLQGAPSSLLRNNGKRPILLSPHVDFQM